MMRFRSEERVKRWASALTLIETFVQSVKNDLPPIASVALGTAVTSEATFSSVVPPLRRGTLGSLTSLLPSMLGYLKSFRKSATAINISTWLRWCGRWTRDTGHRKQEAWMPFRQVTQVGDVESREGQSQSGYLNNSTNIIISLQSKVWCWSWWLIVDPSNCAIFCFFTVMDSIWGITWHWIMCNNMIQQITWGKTSLFWRTLRNCGQILFSEIHF